MTTFEIEKYKPCHEALEFRAQFRTFADALTACKNPSWIMWIAYKSGVDKTLLIRCKLELVEQVTTLLHEDMQTAFCKYLDDKNFDALVKVASVYKNQCKGDYANQCAGKALARAVEINTFTSVVGAVRKAKEYELSKYSKYFADIQFRIFDQRLAEILKKKLTEPILNQLTYRNCGY